MVWCRTYIHLALRKEDISGHNPLISVIELASVILQTRYALTSSMCYKNIGWNIDTATGSFITLTS